MVKLKLLGRHPVELTGETYSQDLKGVIRLDGVVVGWLVPEERYEVLDKAGLPLKRFYSSIEVTS